MISGVVTFPIARREMLVLARSAAMYRTRITNSVALLFLGVGLAAVYHYVGLRALGQVVPTLTFILLLICLFAGVHLTADSIAREKRDGTLGLLLLTNLTPFQIVLGKLIAHGLMGFYAVMIVVPLLSLLMILGGLRWIDVAGTGLAALNIMFFSASVGLWASSRHTDRKKAGGSGTWVVVFFWWGIPVLLQVMNYFKAPVWLMNVVNVFSVNGMFNSVFAGPRLRVIDSPWFNFAMTHLLAWIFVGSATYYLKTRWQEHPAKVKFRLKEWWQKKSLGADDVRRRLRETLLDRNPFLWLAARDRWRAVGLWVTTTMLLGWMGIQFLMTGGDVGAVISYAVILSLIHKALCAGMAAHQLGLEQEQGTLEMILSTPLKAETLLKGQLMATARQLQGPALLCVVVQLAALGIILFVDPFGGGRDWLALGLAANVGLYLFDLYVMAWGGMWGAVTAKEAKNAAGIAMIRIIILPAVIFGLVVTSVSLVNWYWKLGINVPPPLIVGFYFLVWTVNSVAWLVYFKRRLPGLLREFALRRYSPEEKQSFFGRMGAAVGRMRRGRGVPMAQFSNQK